MAPDIFVSIGWFTPERPAQMTLPPAYRPATPDQRAPTARGPDADGSWIPIRAPLGGPGEDVDQSEMASDSVAATIESEIDK